LLFVIDHFVNVIPHVVNIAGRGDSWWRVVIPVSDFACKKDGAYLHQLDRIDFQNVKAEPARFCLANLRILR